MANYKQYILSQKWKNKKQQLFNLKGKECEQCGSTHKIQVHHLNYDNLGDEKMSDLQILCYMCHMSKHDKYFDKFVKNKYRNRRKKRKKSKKKTENKNELKIKKLLSKDFKTLTVHQKREYLKAKGYKLS